MGASVSPIPLFIQGTSYIGLVRSDHIDALHSVLESGNKAVRVGRPGQGLGDLIDWGGEMGHHINLVGCVIPQLGCLPVNVGRYLPEQLYFRFKFPYLPLARADGAPACPCCAIGA